MGRWRGSVPADLSPSPHNRHRIEDMTLDSIGQTLVRHIRRSLVSGLLLLLPIALTYVIIRFVFDLADGVLRPWIEWIVRQFGFDLTLPGPGIVAAVIVVYLIGAIVSFRLGKIAVDWARASLLRVPFVGTIYSANRQLIESFSGTSVTGFKRVVLVQFPRAGTWSLGFLTGVTNADGVEKLIMTYVPTAPLPNSGFVVLMPPQEVLDTNLSVPDAMQLIFSGGIVSPSTIKTRKIDVAEVEEQMRRMDQPAQAITQAVGKSVTAVASRTPRLSVRRLRRSSAKAVRNASAAEHGSVSIARDAMIGAVHAADELGANSVDHVRDATRGIVLGVRDATGVTTRILHDAVAGAIRGGKGREINNSTARGAAEGTIRVAASVGIPIDQAVAQISRATVEALKSSEEELIEGGKSTIKGVITGAATAGENVAAAARHGAYELVSGAAKTGLKDLGAFAAALAEAAVEARAESSIDPERLANAVAKGSIEAADEVSDSVGNSVRSAIGGRLGDVLANLDEEPRTTE